MVIWCTYPELTPEKVEIIRGMIIEEYSWEEIIDVIGLEDREEKVQEVIDILC